METTPNLHDQIALALATEIGFECYKRGTDRYRWVLKRDSGDPRLKNAKSLPIPNSFTQNPCCEIPMDYEIYVHINGTTIEIQTHVKFDLNDPKLVDTIKELFGDLTQFHAAYERNKFIEGYRTNLGLVRIQP